MKTLRSMQLLSMSLVFPLFGCKTVHKVESSETKHIFENTSRVTEPLKGCRSKDMAEQGLPDKRYAKADAYLKKIMDRIIKANPQTFKGNLDPKYFCILTDRNDEFNAFAMPGVGAIVVHDTYLVEMASDASMASTVAHELAHITLNHSERTHPQLAANPEYLRQVRLSEEIAKREPFASATQGLNESFDKYSEDPKIETVLMTVSPFFEALAEQAAELAKHPERSEAIEPNINATYSFIDSFFNNAGLAKVGQEIVDGWKKYMPFLIALEKSKIAEGIDLESLHRSVLGEDFRSILLNWTEQEADEVGYEFFLRAGFNANAYGKGNLDQLKRQDDPDGYELCLASLKGALGGSLVKIERGLSDHPSECWRAYDILVLETQKHEKDYSDLLPKATIETLYPGELQKVKASLPKDAFKTRDSK
jgi:hypothetical protein